MIKTPNARRRETLLPALEAPDHRKVTWTRLRRQASARFRVRSFRPGQVELIEAVFQKRDAFGVMPTGAGKSLCYQLPALFLPKPTLVVSPLIALMQDQHDHLRDADVAVTKVDSTLNAADARTAHDDVAHRRSKLIYVTPERLENPDYVRLLCAQGVALVVIDEAHCVSQWGHDFRPAYLALAHAIRALGRPPILALTATATPEITADVVHVLGMRSPVLVHTGISRENLELEVVRTPNEDVKRVKLMERVRAAKRASTGGVGIIYVATVHAAEELHGWLREGGVEVGCYHGRLPTRERQDVQARFMADEYDAIVATNAFGLGIDKPNVRYVVHYNFPDSLERYYQEAGRAGRDGAPAKATLLYRLEDRRIQTSFLGGKYPRREDWLAVFGALTPARQTVAAIVSSSQVTERRVKVILAELESVGLVTRAAGKVRCREKGAAALLEAAMGAYATRLEDDRSRLEDVMRYAQTTSCRSAFLASYFGLEASCPRCDHCDNCRTDASRAASEARGLHTGAAAAPMPRDGSPAPHGKTPSTMPPGARVVHPSFGEGAVLRATDGHVVVQFEDRERTLRESFFGAEPRKR